MSWSVLPGEVSDDKAPADAIAGASCHGRLGRCTFIPPESKTAEKVLRLGQVGPHFVVTDCVATLAENRVLCDRSLDSYPFGPRVLEEVQIHPDLFPFLPDGFARQCWARVLFSEDGVEFVEIAKFSWQLGDMRSINYPLAVPIGILVNPNAVMRVHLGVRTSNPDPDPATCAVQAKVYTRDPLHH